MREHESPVVVSGIDLPFGDLPVFLFTRSPAAIPAAPGLGLVGMMVVGGLGLLAR